MFKTEGYIEKFAKLLTDQMEMENYTKEQVCIAIEEVLKDFQKDLLESASEGFDEWFRGAVEPAMIKSGYGLVARLKGMAELEVAYEAGRLSSMKELQEIKKDLLESASEDHKSHWNSLTPHDHITLTSYGASEKSWQACALFHKAKIDTLKQRELEYQSDLREKGRLINDKSNQIIEITKELQENQLKIKKMSDELDGAGNELFLQEGKIKDLTEELQEKDETIKNLEEKFKAERNDVLYMDKRVLEEKEKYQEVVKDIEWLLSDCDQDLYTHLEKIDEIKTKYGLDKRKGNE